MIPHISPSPCHQVLNLSVWELTPEQRSSYLPPLDPYDNPLVISLRDFARHPIAQELIHNGQAFQVRGTHMSVKPIRRTTLPCSHKKSTLYLYVWSTMIPKCSP